MRYTFLVRAALTLAAVAGGGGGCGAGADRPGAVADARTERASLVATCVDEDGDGFGPNCTQGSDCDEQDPRITNQCYRCLSPAVGCMCPEGAAPLACDVATDRVVTPHTCWIGQRNCVDGSWTRCLAYAPPFH